MPEISRKLNRALALLVLISICLLGQGLLESNEAGKLALALQQVEPSWNPHDWYLNKPQSYQWLFQQLSGQAVKQWGTSVGAITVRLLGYAAWSWAITVVSVLLGLSTPATLGAVAIFLTHQSLIAGEWMLGGAEPKTFAYAALLIAFAAWQRKDWRMFGMMSGLACTFHILVGGYGAATLALSALIGEPRPTRKGLGHACAGLMIGVMPAAIILGSKHQELLQAPSTTHGIPSVAWIYTYLRNPHHLVPSHWAIREWWLAGIWLALFILAVLWEKHSNSSTGKSERSLGLWTTLSLAVFGAGLAISLWDTEGTFLRFYPFRLGDTLTPLSTSLLLASKLEKLQPAGSRTGFLLIATLITIELHGSWQSHGKDLLNPLNPARSTQEEVYQWIRMHTQTNALILTPPGGFEDMSLKTGRPSVAQFKQIPNRSSDVQEWFARMQAMGGDESFWRTSRGLKSRRKLNLGFQKLNSAELAALAHRYQAEIVVTTRGQDGPERWSISFQNKDWSAWAIDPSYSGRTFRSGNDHSEANPKPISN